MADDPTETETRVAPEPCQLNLTTIANRTLGEVFGTRNHDAFRAFDVLWKFFVDNNVPMEWTSWDEDREMTADPFNFVEEARMADTASSPGEGPDRSVEDLSYREINFSRVASATICELVGETLNLERLDESVLHERFWAFARLNRLLLP